METSVPDGGADIARLMNYPNGLFLRGRRVNPGQYLVRISRFPAFRICDFPYETDTFLLISRASTTPARVASFTLRTSSRVWTLPRWIKKSSGGVCGRF
mgnify:CR=1 FL=1|jgi:hypothetical protein